jgi:hypothetical protein
MQHVLIRATLRVQLICLTLLLSVCIGMVIAFTTNTVPDFDHQLTLSGQHMLTIHHGPIGVSCTPSQEPIEQCVRPSAQRREFSIRYVSPAGSKTWIVLPLPSR